MRNMSLLAHMVTPVKEVVTLADEAKTCNIDSRIDILTEVVDDSPARRNIIFMANYAVIRGLKQDLIIGLPTLTRQLCDFFVSRLIAAGMQIASAEGSHTFLCMMSSQKKEHQDTPVPPPTLRSGTSL
jgi:hypothetical protein